MYATPPKVCVCVWVFVDTTPNYACNLFNSQTALVFPIASSKLLCCSSLLSYTLKYSSVFRHQKTVFFRAS